MAKKVQPAKSAGSVNRQWLRRVRCLTASLARAPTIPGDWDVTTTEPVALERLYTLLLAYNLKPDAFDLTQGFRDDAVSHSIAHKDASPFNKLLGEFGQRFRLTPDRLLTLASTVAVGRAAFSEITEWLLVSDGVTLNVVVTGLKAPQSSAALEGVSAHARSTDLMGLVVHDAADGHLQLGFTFALAGMSQVTGLQFEIRLVSPALSRSKSLPEAG